MDNATNVHPNAVLEALLDKGPRRQKAENLKALHDICAEQHNIRNPVLRDFGLAAIGRLCEAKGVLRARVLYNAASADYVTLIRAWAEFSGAVPSEVARKSPQPPPQYAYLMRIEDPAVRGIMQSVLVERDKLRQQVNILKSQSNLVIDQRPLGAGLAKGSANSEFIELRAQLTDSERSALRDAISPEFLQDQGWRSGGAGEILAATGRVLFAPGYETAIRKILGEE